MVQVAILPGQKQAVNFTNAAVRVERVCSDWHGIVISFSHMMLKVVEITYEQVDLECGCDFLYIYDGRYDTDPKMAELCKMPEVQYDQTTQNYMLLKMTTDDSITAYGFRINWRAGQFGMN